MTWSLGITLSAVPIFLPSLAAAASPVWDDAGGWSSTWPAGLVLVAALAIVAWLVARRIRAPSPRQSEEPEAARQKREFDVLNRIAAIVGRGADLVVTAGETLDIVRELTGMAVGAVYRLDRASETLVLLAHRGLGPDEIEQVRVREVRDSHLGATALAGGVRVVSFEDTPPRDPTLRAMIDRLGLKTQILLPIPVKGETWGVIALVSGERRTFDADEVLLYEAVAHQVGLAVERTALLQEMEAKTTRLETIARLGETLNASQSFRDVLETVIRATQDLLPDAGVRLWLVEGESLVLGAELGVFTDAGITPLLRLAFGEGFAGQAAVRREVVEVEDVFADERAVAIDWVRAQGFVSTACIPLVARGRLLGVLAVFPRVRHRFPPDEMSALRSFANQAAIAIENAGLLDEARGRAAEYRALFEVGAALNSTLDVERVLDTIVERSRALIDAAAVGLFRLDAPSGVLLFERGVGLSPDFVRSLRVEMGEGTTGKAVAEDRPVWSADLLADAHISLSGATRALVEHERYRAVLSVPITIKGARHGALAVYWWEPHQPTPSEIEVLGALAAQAAIAIENARLFRDANEQAGRLRAIAELGRRLVSTFEVDRILELVGTHAWATLGIAQVGICLYDESAGLLRFVAGSGAGFPEDFVRAYRLQPGEGVAGRAFAEGLPVWTSSVLEDPDIPLRAESRSHGQAVGNRAVLALPLMRDRPFGALVVHREVGHRFTDREIEYLSTFASQVAVALENARLYAETTQRLADTRALLEVAEILNSTLEPKRLLRQAAIKIAQVCGVDRCNLERWDGDRVVPLMSQFADGRRDQALWDAFSARPTYSVRDVPGYVEVRQTRQPVAINDTRTTGLIPREWIDTYSVRSTLIVPLIRQDQVMGVMELDYCREPTSFQPRQRDLAMAIAGQLVLSLENSRLYVEAAQRLRETSTLLAAGQALSRGGSSTAVMRDVAREVGRAFGADMVGIYSLDPNTDALRPIAGYHVPKHLVEVFMTRPFVLFRLPALLDSWREGRAAWSSDVKNDPRFDQDTFEGVDPHSVLFAPTPIRGESVGAIFLVWWQTGREFAPDEVRLIEAVARQVGLAMENAELARETQARLAETETLLAVSRTLSSTLDLETMPRQFLRHVSQALGAETAGLWLLDESGDRLKAVAGYHVPPHLVEAYRRLHISIVDNSFYAEAARTLRCVVSHEVSRDLRLPTELREVSPQGTQLFVPIVVNERMLGGFAAVWWERRRDLSDDELRLAQAVANQAGVALENARLFADNRRRVEELSVLHELSQAVTGRLDQKELIDTVYQQVARVLDVSNLVILLRDEEHDELEVALRIRDGLPDDEEPRRYPDRDTGLMSVVLGQGRPLRTANYADECRRRGVAPVPDPGDLPHWLGVPMTAGNRVLGVLALRDRHRAFNERDEGLLANIADLAALALRSARLFEERSRAYGELAAAQDQLIRTEKLRALGEMASGVAHDFNNMLASIVGRAQLLLRELPDPKHRRWTEVIERSALDGAQTVRRLQEFTRIRRDQPFVAVDLNRVVHEALEVTESRWREEPRRRGLAVEVKTALTAPLPAVSGDPAELREAMTNLILNALDAMPDGGVLTLTTAARDDRVDLSVADTGVGIPEEVKQKIFDPFFTTKGARGTGLGLSMTYGILSRHGARVTVESQEGQGTTFRLSFPADAAAAEPRRPTISPPAEHPLRCLVVDDEVVVGEVLGEVLNALGHLAVVFQSGEAAVDRFGREPFDVVFSDLSMPGLSGWEVARAIREVAADIPIFLVTGFGAEISADELREHGVNAVLAKPLKIQDVVDVLAAVRPRAAR